MAQSRPDMNLDPVGWNASWDEELKSTFGRTPRYAQPLSVIMGPQHTQMMMAMLPQVQVAKAGMAREICKIQTDLCDYASRQFATDDFEQKWKALPTQRRDKLVLEAICRTSVASPDMEERRKWCPDVTVNALSGNNGQGFIDMVSKLMPNHLEGKIAEPIYISHDKVDKMIGQDDPLAAIPRMERCYFLTLTVWNTLLAFYGREETYILGKPARHTAKDTKVLREAVKVLPKSEARAALRVHEVFKDRHKEGVYGCWNCGKDASRLPQGQEFKACSKCKTIGRNVRYCSRECQLEDWKNGIPLPHKKTCGRPFEEALEAERPPEKDDSHDMFPAPEPPFKWSPALLHQLSCLKYNPQADYVLINPPKEDQGVLLPRGKVEFLVLRRRALRTGDPAAVWKMFRLLLPFADLLEFSPSLLRSQLEKEYKLNLGTSCKEATPPTDDEIRIVNEWMQTR